MLDSGFSFEPPSDEEIDYEDINSDVEDEEETSDVEEKGKVQKKTQSPWDFSSYTESVADEHARRSTTSVDDKISKFVQQRKPVDMVPEKDEDGEDDSSDSEPDRQEDFQPEEDDEVPTTAGGRDNKSFFTKADGVSFNANSFMDLHLSRPLLRACEALGYTKPTPIQAACIPLALTGRDICGSAITGSGKETEKGSKKKVVSAEEAEERKKKAKKKREHERNLPRKKRRKLEASREMLEDEAEAGVEIEKFGSEDNHTDSNNNDDDDDVEEEYDSEMDTMNFGNEEDVSGNEDSDSAGDANGDDDNESDEHDDDDIDTKLEDNNHADMEELEKEYNDLRHEEQDLFRNLRHDQDDLLKGQEVKNQRALWDKTLEFRFLLQKSFSASNRLPQEPIRSSFCESGEVVKEAYSDLIDSSKKTLDSILKLQEALVEKNPSIMEANDDGDAAQKSTSKGASKKSSEGDEEWFRISQMQSRIAPFRDMSVDKWQRKTQVTSGAAGIKNKFQAFNQNISEQVASYMRDPSRMIKGMQQRRSVVPVFGNVPDSTLDKDEVINADGDPELLDDSEFYQQLLREFFETVDAGSSETAFYAMKRLQTKKRKIVDRRASKSRKIRYHIHEKIVNFMAPEPANIPPMAPKLFENLFGLKTQKSASVA